MPINPIDRQKRRLAGWEGDPIEEINLGLLYHNYLSRNYLEKLNIINDCQEPDPNRKDNFNAPDFLHWSRLLAIGLRRLGIRKNDYLAIISENHIYCLLVTVAAHFLGAIIQPLNVHFTAAELRVHMEKTRPQIIFCTSTAEPAVDSLKSTAEFHHCRKFVFGQSLFDTLLQDIYYLEYVEFSPETYDSNHTAFIMVTSGETGQPKDVILTHKNMLRSITNLTHHRVFDLDSTDSFVLFIPFYHMLGMVLLLSAAVQKCQVITMRNQDPEVFLDNVYRYKTTKLVLTPLLADYIANTNLERVDKLLYVLDIIICSYPVSLSTYSKLRFKVALPIRLNYYITEGAGPTMMGNLSCIVKYGSCGTVVPTMKVKVADLVTRERLPPGISQKGEICLKSDELIVDGYLGEPAATPSTLFDNEGYFKTGDYGFYDDDGHVIVHCKIVDLIKFKDEKVIPSVIELILKDHGLVRDAGVIGIKDSMYGEVPFAFVVLDTTSSKIISKKEIIDFAARILNPSERIDGVEFVEKLPRDEMGKLNRNKLREMYANRR